MLKVSDTEYTYKCSQCGETKGRDGFYSNRNTKRKHGAYCKPCAQIANIRRLYRITYDEAVELRNRACEVCGSTPIKIDHCHSTGVVRGALCGQCNLGIGQFEDNPVLLRAAADYLEQPPFATPGGPGDHHYRPSGKRAPRIKDNE